MIHIVNILERIIDFFKWIIISVIVGMLVGGIATIFYYSLIYVTGIRESFPYIILGLPMGGIIIIWLYNVSGRENDRGTNMVLSAVREEEHIPIRVAPLIIIGTIITHLFGGSAGREGAALQMGGGLGKGVAKLLGLQQEKVKVVIMCGMSGAFSALFGTPLAAAFFSMEVVDVGIMNYIALVPCVISSLVALAVAKKFGVHGESFKIEHVPELSVIVVTKIIFLAIFAALLSMFFCFVLHKVSDIGKEKIRNSYLRIAVAGVLIILLTFLFRTTDYLGAGIGIIEEAMRGEVVPYAFLLKIIFTAITLGAGFKGGEIVPTLFIGATFGCLFGQMYGIYPSLCAAVGMAALFCGVTNCPITSLFISLELFGMEGLPYFMIAVAISYMLSGYSGLYHSQKIVYEKFIQDKTFKEQKIHK